MVRIEGNDLMSVVPKFLEGTAFGVLNDVLSMMRSNEGYAHPNRYEVLIHPPLARPSAVTNQSANEINEIDSREKADISMRCESVTLPGRGVATVDDTNIYGPRRTIANNVSFADSVSMTFQSSSDLRERVMFEKWQHAAFNPKTWNLGYYNDYVGSTEIYLLDKNEQRRYGLKLWECFPKEIGQSDLGYDSNNQIMKITIQMNFRYWTTLDINQQAPSLGDKLTQTLVNSVARNISRNIPAVLRSL